MNSPALNPQEVPGASGVGRRLLVRVQRAAGQPVMEERPHRRVP